MRRSVTLPLYIGGFLGPFGGGIVAVLLPQMRETFDVSTGAVAASIPAYLVPFAAFQLVSGTIGERLGRRRVVVAAYGLYAVASLGCAIAPTIAPFLGMRALQGVANAFLTPLMLAGLAEVVAPERLGRTIGTFAAVQTAAIALSPLCGGLIGEVDWRLAFVATAVVAVALAFLPPADAERVVGAPPARLRAVLVPRVGILCAAAFAGYAGVAGLGFLVAVWAADGFGLGSTERGVLLAGFGVVGIVAGRPTGDLVDRVGRVPLAVVGSAASAVLVVALGFAGTALVLAAVWTLTGLASTIAWAGLNTLTVEAVPENRAGATSVISAFKFFGNAAAPPMWLPLYAADVRLAFAGAAVAAGCVGVLALLLRRA